MSDLSPTRTAGPVLRGTGPAAWLTGRIVRLVDRLLAGPRHPGAAYDIPRDPRFQVSMLMSFWAVALLASAIIIVVLGALGPANNNAVNRVGRNWLVFLGMGIGIQGLRGSIAYAAGRRHPRGTWVPRRALWRTLGSPSDIDLLLQGGVAAVVGLLSS